MPEVSGLEALLLPARRQNQVLEVRLLDVEAHRIADGDPERHLHCLIEGEPDVGIAVAERLTKRRAANQLLGIGVVVAQDRRRCPE